MKQWFAPIRRRPVAWMASLIASVCVLALAHVWLHLQIIALGYDLSRERWLEHQLKEQHERLSLELRARMDLSLMERIAKSELGMVAPGAASIRVVKIRPESAALQPRIER